MIRTLLIGLLLVLVGLPAAAQDTTISDDEVNTIAGKLYCPVCENIPLDVCPTQACSDWREEIRTQLAEGQSEVQIIDDFVARYGERVIGTPQDPFLRALSLVTPWLAAIAALLVAGVTFMHWRKNRQLQMTTAPQTHVNMSDDDYHARLEDDLKKRR